MSFPLGKPILMLIAVGLASGLIVNLRQPARQSALHVWVFAQSHADTYRSMSPLLERTLGERVEFNDLGDSINSRLGALFSADVGGRALPTAAEIEIGSIGRFFRPPVDSVGFLPLNRYLNERGPRLIAIPSDPGHDGWNARCTADGHIYTYSSGRWHLNPSRNRPDMWIDRLIAARLTPWTKDGVIFGLPHDVHPVGLVYREDLFRQAGVDLAAVNTWPAFQQAGIRFQNWWRLHGHPERHAIELSVASSEDLVMMLLQRHVNVVDDRNAVHLDDPRLLDTLIFYARLVAGNDAIGVESDRNAGLWVNDLADGQICCFWAPDWRTDILRRLAPAELRGKLRLMPLPRFDPSDAPTATWGGTMIGIPRACPDPEHAWKLIELLYLSPEGLAARQQESRIVPPLPEQWEAFRQTLPDPLFGGQPVDAMYESLAAQIPPRVVTPVTNIAQITLSVVLSRTVGRLRSVGEPGLESAARRWLELADADIRQRVAHLRFDPAPETSQP